MFKIYHIVPLSIVALFLFTGCEKLDEYTKFEMSFYQTVTVPASSGINLPINLTTPEQETNASSTFESNDTRKDLIEEIQLNTLELEVLEPASADFSFLKEIEIFMDADGLDEQRIAWKEDIPDDIGRFLQLEVSDTDLQEYIKKSNYTLRVRTVTDEALNEDHEINVRSVFLVNAKLKS